MKLAGQCEIGQRVNDYAAGRSTGRKGQELSLLAAPFCVSRSPFRLYGDVWLRIKTSWLSY